MSFPLYDTLKVNLPTKDLTVAQKGDVVNKISTFDSDTHNLIYALIKSFYMDSDKGDSFSIPYNGRLSKNEIEFDLMEMPIKLRQLLNKFVLLHTAKIEEEKVKLIAGQPELLRDGVKAKAEKKKKAEKVIEEAPPALEVPEVPEELEVPAPEVPPAPKKKLKSKTPRK